MRQELLTKRDPYELEIIHEALNGKRYRLALKYIFSMFLKASTMVEEPTHEQKVNNPLLRFGLQGDTMKNIYERLVDVLTFYGIAIDIIGINKSV